MGGQELFTDMGGREHVSLEIQDRVETPNSAQLDACPSEEPTAENSTIVYAPLAHEPSAEKSILLIPECRICQEEEDPSKLETPCACSGSLKYAHRKCVQRWCNEKGDTVCEICHQPYKHGYSAPQLQLQAASVSIDLSDDWGIPGIRSMELRDPRILALAAAQRRFLESEYEEYAAINSGSACCRTVALILMALLLLRHAISMAATTADEDVSIFLIVFLLRVVGFLLPCYIMVRAINMLQGRQNQLQDTAMTAAEVSVFLQAGHPRGIRVALTPAVDLP